ncbi:unnamed protein product [Haemonchus placei]|uniref:Secreted protein n=1 Tax=Haemonchus placei TaxID=6290 RepID=A0A0N4X578_HAEPC|nr:unnamed protein product [Haemonchus placei]
MRVAFSASNSILLTADRQSDDSECENVSPTSMGWSRISSSISPGAGSCLGITGDIAHSDP